MKGFGMREQFLAGHIVGSLTPEQLDRIDAIGAALFKGQPIRVGQRGLVFPRPQFVTQVEKDYQDGKSEGSRRPTAGPRQGRQGPPRPGHSDPADLVRWAVQCREQFEQLRHTYPSAKLWPDRAGTWLAVRTFPIGEGGPQALLLIAVPFGGPRVFAWAYWYEQGHAKWIGPRHTNFNEGSICAFPLLSDHLDCEWPLTRYLDLLSEWCARHLYLALRQKWPGPQEGLWVSYRLSETLPGECCPRCGRLQMYETCCKPLDEADALVGREGPHGPAPQGGRTPPPQIREFAKRGGRNPPKMTSALSISSQ